MQCSPEVTVVWVNDVRPNPKCFIEVNDRTSSDEWMNKQINQSWVLAERVNWLEGLDGTWAKQQCGPKNPQVDLDICSHQHHVLQTESNQKLWSDERQPCHGSPGDKKGQRCRCLSPSLDRYLTQTWLGSLETPSLLLVQIITIPVSWNGAPTAKSERQHYSHHSKSVEGVTTKQQ